MPLTRHYWYVRYSFTLWTLKETCSRCELLTKLIHLIWVLLRIWYGNIKLGKYLFVWYGVKVLTDAFPEIADPLYNPPKVLCKKLDVVKHRAGPRDIMLILKNQYGCKVNPDDFPGRTVVMADQPIETETKGLRSYHIGSIRSSADSSLIHPALMLMNRSRKDPSFWEET